MLEKREVGSANVRLARVCTNWNPTPMRFSHIDAIPQKRALQLHRCDNDMCAVKSQLLPLRPILMTFLAFSPPAVWPGLLPPPGLGYTCTHGIALYQLPHFCDISVCRRVLKVYWPPAGSKNHRPCLCFSLTPC